MAASTYLQVKIIQKATRAGAPPRTPLVELTALPIHPSWRGGLTASSPKPHCRVGFSGLAGSPTFAFLPPPC